MRYILCVGVARVHSCNVRCGENYLLMKQEREFVESFIVITIVSYKL